MMKPGVLPDSGNHINFAPTLAVDGGGTTFNNFSQILEICLTAKIMIFLFFLDLFGEKNRKEKGFSLSESE